MYKTQKLKVHFIFYRPYGNPACKECNGFFPGHDMKPEELFAKHSHETIRTSPPPTEVLKELFDRGNTEGVAAKVLFPQNEARPCYVHLQYVYFVVTLHFPFLLSFSRYPSGSSIFKLSIYLSVQENRKCGAKATKTRKERGLNKKTENQNTDVSYCIVSAVVDSFYI